MDEDMLLVMDDGEVEVPPDYSEWVIRVGIESTGLKFTVGKLCKPTGTDLTYCLRILMDEGVLDDELLEFEDGFSLSLLFGEDAYTWRKRYVYRILEFLGVYHDGASWNYPFTPDQFGRTEFKILALLWVLQCWDWKVNYQRRPEPRLPGVYNRGKWGRALVPSMRCPICSKAMPEPDVRSKLEARLRAFYLWLPGHASEYHKYDILTEKE